MRLYCLMNICKDPGFPCCLCAVQVVMQVLSLEHHQSCYHYTQFAAVLELLSAFLTFQILDVQCPIANTTAV